MLFLDTETKQKKTDGEIWHRMQLGWTCLVDQEKGNREQKQTWKAFRSSEGLCEYIQSLCIQGRTLWLFAHNAFFDLQASDFFYYFTKWGWIRTFYYDKGLTYLLCLSKQKARLKIVSTTNYFAASLKEMGTVVGIEKQEVDFENVLPEQLSKYCKNDVAIIVSFMLEYIAFLKEHDLGSFAMTRASQAFRAYRHRFMKHKIAIHTHPEVIDLERSAYFGGRVECSCLGNLKGGPFVIYDVNSMYPFVMKHNPVPTHLIDYQKDIPISKLKQVLTHHLAIADVDLETDVPLYPKRIDEKLCFPIGRFRTSLCTQGLKEAIKRDHLRKIHRVAFYEGKQIFTEYVDYFYDLKLRYGAQGNKLYREFTKYCLNSLYGKFGQRQPIEESEIIMDSTGYEREEIYFLDTGKMETVTKMLNVVSRTHDEVNSDYTMVAIPAHITEYARFVLSSIIEQVGWTKILYCDTDSVKMRQSDVHLLKYPVSEQALGALSVVRTSNTLKLYGPKDYGEDDCIKMKGIPRKATKNADGSYSYLTFTGQSTHLRRKITRYFIVQETKKELERGYTKGKVTRAGKIYPHKLKEF